MSIFSKLKNWLTGSSSKSSKSATSSKSRKSVKRASAVSNYGGGGSRTVRDSYGTSVKNRYRNREDEEKRRQQEAKRKQDERTNALKQMAKRTDDLSSGNKTSSVTGMQTSGSGRSRVLAKLAEKSKNATPDPRKAQREKSSKDATKMLASIDDKARSAEKKLNNLDDKVRNKVEQDRKSYNKATNNKYNTEVGTKEERARARQRIKSGEYQSDPNAEKWEVKNHPVAASAARGALSGATFGASELLAKTSKNRKESGAEEFYQKNKNKTAENLGEIAGSLASFGGTAALTDKAAAKAVSKLAPRAAEELAGTKLIQKAAVRSATKAAEKGAVKGVSAELIEQIGKNKASKVVNALGNDIVQNLTTGAIYDINKASAEHEVGSPEWWKELGTSAAFNTLVTGGVAAGSIFGGGRRAVREAADTVNMRDAMRRTFARNADNTPKIDMNELLAKRMPEVRPQAAEEITEQAVKNADVRPPMAREITEQTVKNADVEPMAAEEITENTVKNTRQDLLNRRTELQEEWNRFERGETKLTPYQIEELGDELDEVEAQLKNLDETRTEAPQPEAPRTEEPNAAPINNVETEQPRAETPEATAEAPKPEVPRSREELIKLARESQTQKESEDLMKEYFNEYGEVDLGDYGQVTKTADGKYKLSMDGVGEVTLTKAEVEKRIKDSTKRAYTEPDVVDSVTDVVHKRRERASFRQRLKKAGESARRMISDSLSAFEDAERALAKSEHRQVDYGAINEVRAYQAKSNRSISNKQLNFLGDKYGGTVKRVGADGVEYEIENGKSLADIFADMDDETEAWFDAYLTLKHAPARLLQGKPVFDNKVLKDIGNLNNPKVCMAEADKILKEHPEFARKAEEVYQYTQNELKNRVDAGLLKQSVVDDWNKKYPYYVPTGREGFNEIHGISGPIVGAEDIKAAKGSGRNINSIRDQLEASTTRNWRDISTNEMFKKYFGEKTASELAKDADGGIERVLDNSINLGQTEKGGSKQYYAEIFNKGKKEKVEIEPRFYEALADLYKNGRLGGVLEPLDTVNEGFSKVAGLWKNLITEWSPIFMVKNGMRDFPEAIINSRQTKEFLASMSQARKDLATGGPFSEALKDAGISQSTFIDLDKAIREGKDNKSLLSRVNEMVEMYPRLCEYMATFKKAGIDITDPDAISKASRELRARAAANAADVTVNFGRSGSVGKMLNKGLVPFFNPSVQGWSKFVRNITERDLKSSEGIKDALSFFLKATALGAGATTANNLLLSDNPNYQQISARDKATNYIIPWPPTSKDTDTFIKIPSSRFAAAYSLPAVNLANDNKMGFLEMVKVMNDQVAPIDPLESTLFSPFIAAKNNKSWYGTPIVPKALEDLPKSEQYDANTSYIGRALGKATENLPKELQISPKKADYILDAEFGIGADVALPMFTPSKQGGGKGVLEKTGYALGNIPKRAFTIDSTTQNDLSSRFYDKLNEANTNSQSARGTEEDKEEYKRLSAYSTEASSISKAITHLQNSDRDTKQEDIRGLQKVRNQLMQDAIDGKPVPSQAKTLDAVQKYVGTSYAVENFGSSADKEAMKVYGASKYGNLSEAEMQKAIDNDKDFYKGVQAIGKLEDKLSRSGVNTSTTLAKSVALASVNADDDMFGAYQGTKKSRTETATKMDRARSYLADGGSVDEYVKLEEARRTLGKLSDYDKEAELDDILKQLKSGEISESEYYQKQGEVKYNANISYVGLATSLAQANAPARGYVLYDIKTKNVQKGINLAAMGFTARDYREMAKAVDADGNGYPKKQEIIDYVANSDVEDKATLYDALYYYQGKHNPFGRPTNYSRDAAAEVGRKNGVKSISDETGELKLKPDAKSSSGYYRRGYRRRGYRRWHRWGGGGSSAKATVPKPKAIKESAFIKGEALTSKKSSSSKKVTPPKLKRVERKIDLPNAKTTTKKK